MSHLDDGHTHTWNVYRWQGKRGDLGKLLGTIEAPHQPAALKGAWDKWKIATDAERLRIVVRMEADGFAV